MTHTRGVTSVPTPTGTLPTVVTLGTLGFAGRASADVDRLLRQPKRLAVLLYLLLSRRNGSLSREGLTAIFWPESDSVHGRNALRQTVSFLRNCLGADAIDSVGSHGLAASAGLDCDAVRFEALLDENRKEEALQLYGGELLPGFHVDGSRAFAEWLDAARNHLGRRAAKAAWDLSAECEVRGDSADAAFWGKRALALSPFNESEVQRVMRLLDRVGDFAGAIRAYRGLQRALHAEFGAAPSAETAQMASAILQRLESSGQYETATTPRRSSVDRRVAQRRGPPRAWTGTERRVVPDRRRRQRRSGSDRRAER